MCLGMQRNFVRIALLILLALFAIGGERRYSLNSSQSIKLVPLPLDANDPERRKKALEFQGVVDKLFSYGGTRSDSQESPIGLARRFRELAGFTDAEVEDIADVSLAALNERKAAVEKMQQAAQQFADA